MAEHSSSRSATNFSPHANATHSNPVQLVTAGKPRLLLDVPKNRVNKKAYRKFEQEGYTKEELEGYSSALHSAYLSVVSQKPDAIIAPLRGGEILTKSLNLYASLDRSSSSMPRIYYPKTGQLNANVSSIKVNKVNPEFERSMPENEQKREIRRTVERILAQNDVKKNPKRRVLITLIDEVWSGGALTQNVNMLEEVLAEKRRNVKIDFNIVAIADARKQRCPEYKYLQSRKLVKEFLVPRLFTTDSPRFLFPLKREDRAKFLTARLPFRKRLIQRVYSQQAADGRMNLLADLEAMHIKGKVPGKAWADHRLARLPKNISIRKH